MIDCMDDNMVRAQPMIFWNTLISNDGGTSASVLTLLATSLLVELTCAFTDLLHTTYPSPIIILLATCNSKGKRNMLWGGKKM
jgi:hypothetical protein